MTEELKKNGIIPDVENDFKVELSLKVVYNGKEIDGSELTPSATSAQPELKIEGAPSANAVYTIAFVDPDAPSRADPKFRNWRHWIVVNVPGDIDISKGTVLTPYIGPGPPPGTGLHRYTFWVYRQKGAIEAKLDNEPAARRSFDLRAFAKEHDLVGPLGASFFVAQHQQ